MDGIPFKQRQLIPDNSQTLRSSKEETSKHGPDWVPFPENHSYEGDETRTNNSSHREVNETRLSVNETPPIPARAPEIITPK